MIIKYSATGKAVSDFKLKEEIESLEYGETYNYSTDNMILAVRESVFDGIIDYHQVKFYYEDNILGTKYFILIDSEGNFNIGPQGFDTRMQTGLIKLFKGKN